ncbi:GntR family transcriptional regulator [Thermodesulfobacteriota bacterium]
MLQKRDPLFLQAYEAIKERILRGTLVPGERLVETTLARELGVSRNPIREAMRLLMQDGLVHSTASGHIVHSMTIDDIQEIYECRMMVEPFAASLAAQRILLTEISTLYHYIDQAESSFASGDIDGTIQANSSFHNSIVQLCQNQLVYSTFKMIDNLVVVSRNIEMKVHQRPPHYLGEHRKMVKLLEARKGKELHDLVMDHIRADWNYFKKFSEASEKELLAVNAAQ